MGVANGGAGEAFATLVALPLGPTLTILEKRAWSHLQNFSYVLSPAAFIWTRQIIFIHSQLQILIMWNMFTEQVTTYGENGLLFLVESDEFIEGQNVDQDSKGKW